MTSVAPVFIHDTAEISPDAHIGAGSRIWHGAQIREGSCIGSGCVIGKDVYVDVGVVIGDRVKIQNNVSVYHGVTIEDGAFIGPHVCFTNDVLPRAITLDGSLKREEDWIVGRILVRVGASIGAGSVILPNVTIGLYALVGAGSVITRSVPDHALVYGNPARQHGYVCRCGCKLINVLRTSLGVTGGCPACQQHFTFAIPSVCELGAHRDPDCTPTPGR